MARRTVSGAVIGAEETLALDEAVWACTLDAAASVFADDRLGSLEVGKLADVVVLDGDLFAAPRDRVAGLGVTLTLVGGRPVYDADRRIATSDNIS